MDELSKNVKHILELIVRPCEAQEGVSSRFSVRAELESGFLRVIRECPSLVTPLSALAHHVTPPENLDYAIAKFRVDAQHDGRFVIDIIVECLDEKTKEVWLKNSLFP